MDMGSNCWLRRIRVLPIAVGLVMVSSVEAQSTDVIRGRVLSDSGVALVAVDVIVTMAPSAESFSTRTDSAGRYRVQIPNGSGEYLLYVGAVGWRPSRQRVTRKATESEFVIEVKLAGH